MMRKGTMLPVTPCVFLFGLLLFSACVSTPQDIPVKDNAPGWSLPAEESYSIGNYQDSEFSEKIPLWVNTYLEGGIAELESSGEFEGSYVFVAENSGTNINALNQWSQGFSFAQDIAQLVARRVQARFPGSDTGSPDREYGRYFENLVRTASDAFYSGAQRRQDFWFQKQYSGGDIEGPEEESYVFLVLLTIDKDILRAQLETVLAKALEGIQTTRDQTAAITRLREYFFDGF
jgi:hypothetical protein